MRKEVFKQTYSFVDLNKLRKLKEKEIENQKIIILFIRRCRLLVDDFY